MELLTQIVISGILSVALSIIAYKLRMLTFTGALASLVVGYTVGVFGSVYWLILLVIFTAAGLVATKMDFSNKSSYGLQEGDHGERSHLNVLGVGLPACIFAFLYLLNGQFHDDYSFALTVAFITTLTVAAADTVGSEIGIRDGKVWLITTFERVKRGTNGGISVTGTVSSLIASVFTGLIGWLLIFDGISIYILVPMVMGLVGSLLDSVFGATLENKGRMSKYANNSLSAIISAVLGMLIVLYI